MPTDLWAGQLIVGSMTPEEPRLHAECGLPDYVTDAEREHAARKGLNIGSVFGHTVPGYPRLPGGGLEAILADAEAARRAASRPKRLEPAASCGHCRGVGFVGPSALL